MKHIRQSTKVKAAQLEQVQASLEGWRIWLDWKVCQFTPDKNKCLS